MGSGIRWARERADVVMMPPATSTAVATWTPGHGAASTVIASWSGDASDDLVYKRNVRASTLREVAERVQPGKGGALVIDEGKAEGRAEGRVEERAEGLRQLLEHRFGRLPLAALGRIADASASELAAWFKAALDATSLNEVFGEPALE